MIASTPSGQSFPDIKAVRDYCLPGIWKREDANGRELDLVCNQTGGIDLRVCDKTHQLFTAKELSRPFWLAHFNPRVIEILEGK